eukprot:GGOE01055335.1.p1 GENE.GGOE01055335.1~~GGOE01055335.1.p1  ORF type:complete len:599 (+),score=73.38 GGOE01055335.1:59-1855(+)
MLRSCLWISGDLLPSRSTGSAHSTRCWMTPRLRSTIGSLVVFSTLATTLWTSTLNKGEETRLQSFMTAQLLASSATSHILSCVMSISHALVAAQIPSLPKLPGMKVAVFAGALQSRGVGKGDCVLIYLPMVPEAFVAMLACARIGAIHSVVFGGFAAPELCNRINAATPKCLITASCGLLTADHVMPYKPIVDDAIEQANHKPEFCVVLQQPQVHAWLTLRDVEWNDFVANAQPVPCVPLESTDNLYVLYTSGTTGDTKGIARDNAGHCVALKWTMDAIYGVEDDDVFWASSDIGWVVGHSYIIYAPLFRGITTVMYDGKPTGTPDSGAFWRVMAEHKVNIVLAAPNSFRAIRREDPNARRMRMYDLSQLKAVYLAGEHTDLGTLRWLQAILQRKLGHQRPLVFDHYWQTETGWAIAGPCPGLCGGYSNMTVKFGSCHRLVPGFQVQEMDEDCKTPHPNPSKVGDQTYPLAIRLPLPPDTPQERRALPEYIHNPRWEVVQNGRRWLPGRGRVCVRADAHGRLDQSGGPPAGDCSHRGDRRLPPCRRRVCRFRHPRQPEGTSAGGLYRAEGWGPDTGSFGERLRVGAAKGGPRCELYTV